MPEAQNEIDALLAEMSALADAAEGRPAGAESAGSAAATATLEPPARAAACAGGRTAPGVVPGSSTAEPRIEDVRRILTLEVPVIVQLAERSMPLAKILNLSTGAIIEFEKPFDAPLELKINNKCIAIGQAVKVDENFGLRVTAIGSVKSRIQAMGGN